MMLGTVRPCTPHLTPIPRLAPVVTATRRIVVYLRLGPRDNEIEHGHGFREASN